MDDYEMYLDVSQRDKKGRVYGIGGAAPHLFPPSHLSSSKQSGGPSYTPTPIARYASQNAELRNTVTQLSQSYEELQQQNEIERKRNAWLAAKMQEQFGWTYPEDSCHPGPPPHPRDDFEDDGSGGTFQNTVVPPV